jgi:hypothetical protein
MKRKTLLALIVLSFIMVNICLADDSDTQVILMGNIVVEDPITHRTITYEGFAPVRLFEQAQSQLGNIDAIQFIKSYIGKKMSNDTRSIQIREGVVKAYYGKYIVVYSPDMRNFYINIIVEDVNSAYQFRNAHFPRKEDIPYGVSFEIWTAHESIIGRDRLGDYQDLME